MRDWLADETAEIDAFPEVDDLDDDEVVQAVEHLYGTGVVGFFNDL